MNIRVKTSKATTDNYVSVNGLEMYYELHGTGQPLVDRADWLIPMIDTFLDAPVKNA